MSHVFISYVREDTEVVQRLCDVLRVYNIEVWLDREQLKPGYRWADAIQEAIRGGAFYIACFSKAYNERLRTYMNEELTLAIEELRQRPTDQSWFIPVLLDNCNIPNRRIGAGETLRSLQWVSLYSNWNDGIRRILSVIQPNSARVHELIQALGNKSARTRIKAADDLGLLGELAESAIPSLIQVLDDGNETVCAAAAHALGEIGKATELVIAKLTANVQGKDSYANHHAIMALIKLGDPGIHALINVVDSPHYTGVVKIDVQRALSNLGKPVLEPLLDDLNSGSITDSTAYEILSEIRDPNATPKLTEALGHKIPLIQIAAAGALIVILSGHDQSDLGAPLSLFTDALSTLIEGIKSNDYGIRSMAIFTVRKIGKPASKTVPALIEAMNDPKLLRETIFALEDMESEAKQAVPALIKALDEKSVRDLAVRALGRIGEPSDAIVPALIKALHDG